jgi:hypothetical protein
MSLQHRPVQQRPSNGTSIAPDGQRTVQQQDTRAEEREEIARNSEHQDAVAREQRAQEPSTRFWSSRRAQAGPILALLAGLITLAFRTWPIVVPQGRGSLGTFWFLAATLIGALYVISFFLADRRWKLARAVLIGAGVLHLVVGFAVGTVVGAQEVAPGSMAMLFDVVPAIMALVAAFLISPPPATLHGDR